MGKKLSDKENKYLYLSGIEIRIHLETCEILVFHDGESGLLTVI